MSKTNEKNIEKLFNSCMGETIHTAFRKGSDHPSSAKVWKAISDMPSEEWDRVVSWMSWALAYSLSNEIHVGKAQP